MSRLKSLPLLETQSIAQLIRSRKAISFATGAREARSSVASLAGCAAAEQAGHVAEHGYAHVGPSRGTRRRGDALVVTAQYRAALRVADVVTGGVRAQGVEHSRHVDAHRDVRVVHADVQRE